MTGNRGAQRIYAPPGHGISYARHGAPKCATEAPTEAAGKWRGKKHLSFSHQA